MTPRIGGQIIGGHHKETHQDGGADEISIADLAGESTELATHKVLTTGVHGVGASTVCSETVADEKIAAAVPPAAQRLTVAQFQANAATGTAGDPQQINNDNVANGATFDTIDEYCEIDWNIPMFITQFRYYGWPTHAQDGSYKIQYYDEVAASWTDWKTAIPTRLASWSSWETISTIFTSKVRIIATAIDTAIAASIAREWEIKY